MKRIIKNILTLFALAVALVACEDAQPIVDTSVKDTIVSSRETLVSAEAYAHDDVYGAGDSYKITLALASDGVETLFDPTVTYNSDIEVYAGTGYLFELELNSAAVDAIVPGLYVADGDDTHEAGTYNLKNSYVILANGVGASGKATKMPLHPDTKLIITQAGTEYKIIIDGKNAVNIPVKGTYEGKIDVYDINYYREPITPKTFDITAESVEYIPSEENSEDMFGSYLQYYGVGITEHTFNITGSKGEIVSLYILDFAEEPIHLDNLSSGVYEFEESFYDLTKEGVYDTSKNYRIDAMLGYSSYLFVDGEMFYIEGEAEIEMDSFGTKVESLLIKEATSAYGSTISVSYTREK